MKDIYINFSSGVVGDSTDAGHAKQVEATSFSHVVHQPRSATSSSAGGHTAERVEFGDVTFTKDIDTATPHLLHATCMGTLFPEVTVEFYRAYGGTSTGSTSNSRVMYYKLVMKNVIVSSVTTVIGPEGLPAETFTLKPSAMSWAYDKHNIDGSKAGPVTKMWNLAKNTPTLT